jgi:4-hydroxy-tetrahydrodipicolinate reductase
MTGRVRVCLAGATGWVGRALAGAIAEAADLELAAAVARRQAGRPLSEAVTGLRSELIVAGSVEEALAAPCDVLVDYTGPEAVRGHVLAAVSREVSAVVGTSGLSDEDYAVIDAAARERGVGVLAAGNFAVTAVLLQRLAEIAARHVPHWEIIDYGKLSKPDAPSGTARELSSRLARIGKPQPGHPVEETQGLRDARGATLHGTQMHSVRLPGFVSSIEILFGLPEERLSIRHDSSSGAAPYVAGTLLAIRRVRSFTGLKRGLDSVMDL